MNQIEHLILYNLQENEDYIRKVIPYLKEEYFFSTAEKQYFSIISKYFERYNALPTKEIIEIEIQNIQNLDEKSFDDLIELKYKIDQKKDTKQNTLDWLLDNTEKFCKDKALYNALTEAISISENSSKNKLSTTAIPDILSSALAVSFDTKLGHDYIDNADQRFEFFNRKINKLPTHLESLNLITNGGPARKTINCIAAGTGVGKSLLLCNLAAGYYRSGLSVLYFTLEMEEEKIAERIDADLMNLFIADVSKLEQSQWKKNIETVKSKCTGKLVIKEYPTSSAGTIHFKFFLKELKQKKNFVPDVIIVDYLNICASNSHKDKSNSYGYIKAVAEELRAFAQENNVGLWTATQLNRDGIDNSEVELKNISESMGGPMTFDFLFALIQTEDLATSGQIMLKQLKNRYANKIKNNKIILGYDADKLKIYDLSQLSNQITTTNTTMNNKFTSSKQNTTKQKTVSNIRV